MGMYTELHFNSALKEDTKQEIIDILKYMVKDKEKEPEKLPDHPFFDCERWKRLFTTDSFYFDADTHSTLRFCDTSNQYFLCVRINIKNYDGEIGKFIDWINKYLDKFPGDFIGFSRYEEYEDPTLLFA